jgi:hypothetical protein
MKVVFVAGFYDPIKTALESAHPDLWRQKSLIWIGAAAPKNNLDLGQFSGRYFQQLSQGIEGILVLAAARRGSEWVTDQVASIMQQGRERFPLVPCELQTTKNLGDKEWISSAISKYGIPLRPAELTEQDVRAKLGAGSVFCVSMSGRTSILDALGRASFTKAAIDGCFVEERIQPARNSSLMDHLISRAQQYDHLLYAWDGLRTLKPEVKSRFRTAYEAHSAAAVVELFSRWINGGGG